MSDEIDRLVASHRELVRFVERRIDNRAIAEDIVQDAFVRGLERGDEIRAPLVGWFYRLYPLRRGPRLKSPARGL